MIACYRGLGSCQRIFLLHVSGRVSGTFASAEITAPDLGDGRVRGRPHAEPELVVSVR